VKAKDAEGKGAAYTDRSGQRITRTVRVPEPGVILQTPHTCFPLIGPQLDILLMRDGRSSKVFDASIGSVLAAALNLLIALYNWAERTPRPDLWGDTKSAVMLMVLALVVMGTSWLTLKGGYEVRSKLIEQLRDYFDEK